MAPRTKGSKKGDKKVLTEVITKECTIHMHKRIHGMYALFALHKLM